jgi:hypothetical protein
MGSKYYIVKVDCIFIWIEGSWPWYQTKAFHFSWARIGYRWVIKRRTYNLLFELSHVLK